MSFFKICIIFLYQLHLGRLFPSRLWSRKPFFIEDKFSQKTSTLIPPWRAMAYALHGSNLKLVSFRLLVCSGFIAPLPWSARKRPELVYVQAQRVRFHISDVTVDGAKAWKSDAALPPEVTPRAHVDLLDQALLIEEGMVGTQCTGSIIITLVVVAQVRLPHGGNVLVHMHLLAQRHHQEDTYEA